MPSLKNLMWAHANLALAIKDIVRKHDGKIKLKKLVKIMGGETIRPTVLCGIKTLIANRTCAVTKKDNVVLCSTKQQKEKYYGNR